MAFIRHYTHKTVKVNSPANKPVLKENDRNCYFAVFLWPSPLPVTSLTEQYRTFCCLPPCFDPCSRVSLSSWNQSQASLCTVRRVPESICWVCLGFLTCFTLVEAHCDNDENQNEGHSTSYHPSQQSLVRSARRVVSLAGEICGDAASRLVHRLDAYFIPGVQLSNRTFPWTPLEFQRLSVAVLEHHPVLGDDGGWSAPVDFDLSLIFAVTDRPQHVDAWGMRGHIGSADARTQTIGLFWNI